MVLCRLQACLERLTVVGFQLERPAVVGLQEPLVVDCNDESAVARMGAYVPAYAFMPDLDAGSTSAILRGVLPRLDVDVDGTTNSLVVDRLVTKTLPQDHPRRSLWVRESMLARTEAEARLNIDLKRPALWRVLNRGRSNHVGYPTSYQLFPGKNTSTLLSADDDPRRRAGFIDYYLWVTPYRRQERFAAVDYPTLSEPGQDLPEWTRTDRWIENTDIVLWYTVGMHHMVRAEDWPVMPVLWHTFELRPFDFFDRNPALDLPRKR